MTEAAARPPRSPPLTATSREHSAEILDAITQQCQYFLTPRMSPKPFPPP